MNIQSIKTGFNSLKNTIISMDKVELAAKAVGAVGIGVALYDSHKYAKGRAINESYRGRAKAGINYLNNTLYSSNGSTITQRIKNKMFGWETKNRLRGTLLATGGYVKGLFSNILSYIVPIATSVGAIALKGNPSKICAGLTGAYGLMSIIRGGSSHLDKGYWGNL